MGGRDEFTPENGPRVDDKKVIRPAKENWRIAEEWRHANNLPAFSEISSNFDFIPSVQESVMPEQPENVAAWEDLVLRLIAVYKLSKTLVFIAIGVGLLHLLHHNVAEMLRVYLLDPMHFDPDSRAVHWAVDWASKVTPHSLRLASYFSFIAAAFFATEGIGLFLRKHWAEYLVLVSTGSLLPLEIYEMWVHIEWWKAAVLLANIDSQNAARRRAEREARQKAKDQRRNPPGAAARGLVDPT
jgi:uncharacterized membrane protein (DUF2068 family)